MESVSLCPQLKSGSIILFFSEAFMFTGFKFPSVVTSSVVQSVLLVKSHLFPKSGSKYEKESCFSEL